MTDPAPDRLELAAPAKVNLSLTVLGRRADGYHDLVSLFQPLELADRVIIERAARPGLELACLDSDLPTDAGNLVHRAATSFFRASGVRPEHRITVYKNIPVAAGLGGGSSDAATTLKGLNQLHNRPLSETVLAELALALGADVPFFLSTGPAWAEGVGEKLTETKLPKFGFILINPGFAVSTASVFGRLGKPLTSAGAVDSLWPTVRAAKDAKPLVNDLEPVVASLHPVIGRMKRVLTTAGAIATRMSGSGPTVFGLFDDFDQARESSKILRTEDGWRVIVTAGL